MHIKLILVCKPLKEEITPAPVTIKMISKIPGKTVTKEGPKSSNRLNVNEIKEKLAECASLVLEDPEKNVAEIKTLQKYSLDPRTAIVQLSLLTQLAVFIDIIPGYRIRKLTDGEKKTEVSKEIRKLRNFEETLLANYQSFLQTLETMSKSNLSNN